MQYTTYFMKHCSCRSYDMGSSLIDSTMNFLLNVTTVSPGGFARQEPKSTER